MMKKKEKQECKNNRNLECKHNGYIFNLRPVFLPKKLSFRISIFNMHLAPTVPFIFLLPLVVLAPPSSARMHSCAPLVVCVLDLCAVLLCGCVLLDHVITLLCTHINQTPAFGK
jgi:hypothetical protein